MRNNNVEMFHQLLQVFNNTFLTFQEFYYITTCLKYNVQAILYTKYVCTRIYVIDLAAFSTSAQHKTRRLTDLQGRANVKHMCIGECYKTKFNKKKKYIKANATLLLIHGVVYILC